MARERKNAPARPTGRVRSGGPERVDGVRRRAIVATAEIDLDEEDLRALADEGIDPDEVQVLARTPREDIKVGVQVRGPLDSPSLNLYSSPPMNQEAQLSWLVLGRPLDDGTGDAERQAVASAALALGLKGTDFIAGKLSSKLGIDEISIGSKPGETADQARFTIGKYLSPKLYVSYGVGLFQPGYSVQMEYDIGSGFKLATETGVESGGDLIYTIER